MNSNENGIEGNKLRKLTFEELYQKSSLENHPFFPVTVLLDDIRSLHNVGSIFRSADGARVQQLCLCGITGKPPRNEIRKTSLGAEESVPWSYYPDAGEAVQNLKSAGYQIVALEQTTHSVNYQSAQYKFPLCLIVGHEFNGIQNRLLDMVDLAVEIPMFGKKQSLNVSVAFGITIYEIISHFQQIAEKQK